MTSALVIKIGGALLNDEQALAAIMHTFSQLHAQKPLVLVHGGGDTVQALLSDLNLESQKIDGRRVTPEDHIPYVSGALAGTVNKQLCAAAKKQGLVSVGLSLADGNMTTSAVLDPKFGAVGLAAPKDPILLNSLLANHFFPVISSIGCSREGQLLNVNADDAAIAIAQLLDAPLVLLSDVPGVLDDQGNLIEQLSAHHAAQLKADSTIHGGMVVKVEAAQQAATALGHPVTIASWRNPQALLALTSGTSVGTQILPDNLTSEAS